MSRAGARSVALVLMLAATSLAAGVAAGRWTGATTGEGERCRPLTLHLVVEAGTITGEATMQTRGGTAVWPASGTVGSDATVTLVIETSDGAVGPSRRRMRWTGRVGADRMELEQAASVGCAERRRATLTRP
jgi:hypothetical protein